METSGTIGLTRFNTARLVEKALRRCGLNPASITPETVVTAKEDLFLLLLSLSNKGLNLWTIDKRILSLVPNKATYVLPLGTQDILNMMFATPSLITEYGLAETSNVHLGVAFNDDHQRLTRFGIRFKEAVKSITLKASPDLIEIVDTQVFKLQQGPMVPGQLYWFDIDPAMTSKFIDITLDTVIDPIFLGSILDTIYLDQGCSEITVTPFNRDDYTNQPRKTFVSNTITNFWFEKLVNPQVTFWPVPGDETKCIEVWRYRQVQDIGELTDEIEIPSRWYEAICWHLALRLAFELPGIDPGRLSAVQQMAMSMVIEVEAGETDSSPVYFQPNIGVYTK